jgi:hypothetical protein
MTNHQSEGEARSLPLSAIEVLSGDSTEQALTLAG